VGLPRTVMLCFPSAFLVLQRTGGGVGGVCVCVVREEVRGAGGKDEKCAEENDVRT
jgi:hypothetical protein